MRVTAIQLDIINIPAGKGLSIILQIPQYPWISCTCVITKVFIDSKLQPFCMNLHNKYTGFCCKIDDIWTLLACYTVYGSTSLPTFWDNLSVLSSRGLRSCPETSVRNFHHMLCKIPEECRYPRHRYVQESQMKTLKIIVYLYGYI